MRAIEFPGCNVVYGANQPEYLPLPAMRMPDGEVITCYELTDEEVDRVIKNKRIYICQLTFNGPLAPQKAMVELGDDIALS